MFTVRVEGEPREYLGRKVETQVDRPYVGPATRRAVARYLAQSGNTDLIEVFGLQGVDVDPPPAYGRTCPTCPAKG